MQPGGLDWFSIVAAAAAAACHLLQSCLSTWGHCCACWTTTPSFLYFLLMFIDVHVAAGAALPAAPPALPRHRRYLAPGHLFRWAGAFTMRGALCVCQPQCRPGTVAVQVTGPVPACCSLVRLRRSQPAGTASCECSGCGDSGGAGAPGAPRPDPTSAASSCAGPINGRLLAMRQMCCGGAC